ncbi:MAG: hypothetical protein CL899_01510 [Dehalococcoidia bacterium]|nr:hypothetical protein [Dehalococcoidia bacterium]
MRKVFFALFLVIFSLSCSNFSDEPVQVDTIYSMDDASKLGIKNLMKGDFETEFPEATHAKWGFWKGREVAILRYESVEKARTLGKTAAEEQTELVEVVESNIAHGPKVEKTKCRGDAYGGTPYRLSPKYNIGIGGTLILNKSSFKDLDVEMGNQRGTRGGCVRREPLYIQFKVHGNLVIMIEPMPEEDRPAMDKIIDEVVSKLP